MMDCMVYNVDQKRSKKKRDNILVSLIVKQIWRIDWKNLKFWGWYSYWRVQVIYLNLHKYIYVRIKFCQKYSLVYLEYKYLIAYCSADSSEFWLFSDNSPLSLFSSSSLLLFIGSNTAFFENCFFCSLMYQFSGNVEMLSKNFSFSFHSFCSVLTDDWLSGFLFMRRFKISLFSFVMRSISRSLLSRLKLKQSKYFVKSIIWRWFHLPNTNLLNSTSFWLSTRPFVLIIVDIFSRSIRLSRSIVAKRSSSSCSFCCVLNEK